MNQGGRVVGILSEHTCQVEKVDRLSYVVRTYLCISKDSFKATL